MSGPQSLMGDLQRQIVGLSATEKFDLLDVLWESLEADPCGLTDEQRAELDYRVARYEQHPSDMVPWEQVKAGLLRRH